jgi:hypothetical protein
MQTRFLCSEGRKHLLTSALAGQKDGVHFMLRIFGHFAHVTELYALVSRRLVLISADLKCPRK